AYGNYRMAYLFTKQKTECFQEAHALFFEKVGGVYQTMVYDNIIATWLKTGEPYRDILLTIAVAHFVMSRLITIKKKEVQNER
ncbi:hypothetical protein ACE1TI_21775, partial [Alteribacillus sp. JSM 102045]|uniref:hypothetical protein n=1 Tax=Alteribacillus sp. JSM 102045 TaxID=1562101 RepID=UPI0035BEEC16